jgi:hypothetical protein
VRYGAKIWRVWPGGETLGGKGQGHCAVGWRVPLSPGVAFLIWWATGCAIVAGIIVAGVNFDRIAVFVLSVLNAPVYEEARRIAASIYNTPQQWKPGIYGLTHERIGSICSSSLACSLYLSGDAYGTWQPNFVERRIIYDAVRWHRRMSIRAGLHETTKEMR